MFNKLWKNIKEDFMRTWKPSHLFYEISLCTFFATTAIIVSVQFTDVRKEEINLIWLLFSISFLSSLLTLIRIKMEPCLDDKLTSINNKLDTLLKEIKKRQQQIIIRQNQNYIYILVDMVTKHFCIIIIAYVLTLA